MSFLWLDSGATLKHPIPTSDRRPENVSKTASAHAIHPRHDDHTDDQQLKAGKQATDAYTSNQSLPVSQNEIIASQIMSSPVITIQENTTVTRVWELLQENHFRHLPVTTLDQHRILGIVSDRSIAHSLAYAATNDTDIPALVDVMRKPVLVATAETDVRHIAKIMISQRIGAMPIVDENQHLLGIITRSDVLKMIVRNHDLTLWV